MPEGSEIEVARCRQWMAVFDNGGIVTLMGLVWCEIDGHVMCGCVMLCGDVMLYGDVMLCARGDVMLCGDVLV